MARAEKLFTRLRAARLDNTLEAEFRRLTRLDLLIIDDFALRPLDATTTADFYELVVERHRKAATIFTSNRDPADWLTMTDRPHARPIRRRPAHRHAHTLIIEGPSYRQRTSTGRAPVDPAEPVTAMLNHAPRWSHARGNDGGPITLASDRSTNSRRPMCSDGSCLDEGSRGSTVSMTQSSAPVVMAATHRAVGCRATRSKPSAGRSRAWRRS